MGKWGSPEDDHSDAKWQPKKNKKKAAAVSGQSGYRRKMRLKGSKAAKDSSANFTRMTSKTKVYDDGGESEQKQNV